MDNEYNPEELGEGEREEQDDAQWEPSKQAIMILIEATPTMLEMAPTQVDEDEDEEGDTKPRSFLGVALDAVAGIMKWRMLHAPNDEIGVMFYCAANSNVDAAFESVHEMVELGAPDIATVHRLQEFSGDSVQDAAAKFKEEIGIGDVTVAAGLRHGLWATKEKLAARTKTSKATSRRLFVFTCTPDPIAASTEDQRARNRELIDQRLDDLHGLRTGVEVFPLPALREPFNMAAYWNHAIQVASGLGDESMGGEEEEDDSCGVSSQLPAFYDRQDVSAYLQSVQSKAKASRPTGRFKMRFPGGLEIAVQMYSLLRPASRPPRIKVTKESYQDVKTNTAFIAPDGNLISDPSKRAINVKTKTGGTDRIPRAVFDNSELDKVRAPRPAGLAILGFKPSSALAAEHTLAPARFIYPDERRLKGSTPAFIALRRALLDQDKVAIARLVIRAGNSPSLVALLPQLDEDLDPGDWRATPPGLHLLQLPWRDELRFPEKGSGRGTTKIAEKPKASAEQIQAAAAMVTGLTMEDFAANLRDVPNPSLQRHYDTLEKLALRYEQDELQGDIEDATLPDEDALKANAGLFDDFSSAVYGESGAGAAGKTAGAKRKASEPEPHISDEYNSRDWYSLAEGDQLSRLTNDQLKVYLKYNKLTLGGKKADLIARVKEHVLRAV